MTLRDAAQRYAARSLAVFPVTPNAKTPITQHGVKDATKNIEQVVEWWQRWPKANIGLACGENSGVIVFDFDCKNGKRGLATLADLERRFDLATLTAQTPSGGVHLFFQYADGLRNAVEAQPGLDIRTTGGYVLVAPSVVDGRPYKFTNKFPPAQIPRSLLALLQKPKPEATITAPRWMPNRLEVIERASRYVRAVPAAIQGQAGDVTTFKLACRLVRGFALSDHEALTLLMSWNYRCSPRWSESELIAKITSARKNGIEPIGARLEAR